MSATAPKTNGRRPRAAMQVAGEGPQSLAQALLAFQAEAPKLRTNADGQIQSRVYRYVTLDGVLDDVVPLLQKHELVWTAKVVQSEGAPAAQYRMEHVPSGDFEEWTGPLPCVEPGPQNLGSAITYMRRYTLVAYLNLAPGEDDDGAAASTTPVDRYAEAEAAHASAARQPSAAPVKASERPCSAAQRKMLRAKAGAADLTSVQFANVVMVAKGDQPRDTEDQEAAERWLGRELDRLPARLVDAVIDGIEGPRP